MTLSKNVEPKKASDCGRSSSAVAVKSFVTKLYDGTAELRIVISKTSMEHQGTLLDAGTSPEPEVRECYEMILPPLGPNATENDGVVALISSLTDLLLKNIESAKQQTKKAVQAEGISRAKAEGKHFGRQSLALDEELFEELCRAYADNTVTPEEAGRQLGCSYRTFLRRYAKRTSPNDEHLRVFEQNA